MAKKDWSEMEGLPWRLDVGSTLEEAMQSENGQMLYVTKDGQIVMNGEVIANDAVHYLGSYSLSSGGENAAKQLSVNCFTKPILHYTITGNNNWTALVRQVRTNNTNVRQWLRLGATLYYRDVTMNNDFSQATSCTSWTRLPEYDSTVDSRITKNRDDIANNIQKINANTTRLDGIDGAIESFGESITDQALRIYNLEHGKPLATQSAPGFMSAEDKVKVDTLNGGIAQQKDGSYKTLTGKAVIETHSDVVGEEVSLTDFNNAQATTYNKGDVINIYYTKGAYGVLAQKDMLWFGRRVVSNDSSNGTLVKYDFKTIAGVEPKDAFNSDITLYFLTLKGYTSAFRGSAGYTLYPLNVSAVPYLPSTADKVLLEKIKQKLGL